MEQGITDPLQALTEDVKKIKEMVAENNAMLQSVQRRARMVILVSSLKWIVIIGISLGSFYFLQPFLENAFGAYRELSGGLNSLQGLDKLQETVKNMPR